MLQAPDAPPDVAYVLGLLADLERRARALEAQLTQSQAHARPHDAAFAIARRTWQTHQDSLKALATSGNQTARALSEANAQCAQLLQDVANLNRKSEDLRRSMQALATDSDGYRQLRRTRAALGVQLEDRTAELKQQQQAAQTQRDKLAQTHLSALKEGDAARAISASLKALQALQPAPSLYLDLFAVMTARAHATVTLEAYELKSNPSVATTPQAPDAMPPRARAAYQAWRKEILAATTHVVALYEGLEAGRYAVEQAASWAGGRAVAVSEALYAMVALGELEGAIALFGLSGAHDAFFHHIFQTFRGGCLGLFLVGRHRELAEALRLHQDAQGIRGAYVAAFGALLAGDTAAFYEALQALAQAEWRQWRTGLTPGLGVVNVTVLGLCELSRLRGFAMPPEFGPTVPWLLVPR